MKRLFFPSNFWKSTRLLSVLIAILPVLSMQAAELLSEYDFESVPPFLPNWAASCDEVYKPATGWKTPFTVALDKSNPHSGSKAVQITFIKSATGSKKFLAPRVPIPQESSSKAQKVRVRFFYRLNGLPEGGANFTILEFNGKEKEPRFLENKKSLAALPPTDAWRVIQCEGMLDPGTRSILLMWVNTSDTVPATLCIDDVATEILTD
ncbi:MAG: hypothetical protein ACFUZC_10500 [Chthoniobacteraceae bacterium]